MKPTNRSAFLAAFAILAGLIIGAGAANGQDLKAKYAPILGTYQFDLSSLGIGMLNADFYVEGNVLYSKTNTDNEPTAVTPVEGKEFEFTINDPDEGLYTLTFLKDEKGQYTKCHVVNAGMGIDVVGAKIAK
jgi:hypothetical protein